MLKTPVFKIFCPFPPQALRASSPKCGGALDGAAALQTEANP